MIGGAIVTTTDKLAEDVHFLLNGMGTNAAPFDSWLVLRGIKTLPLRMERHASNALTIAEYLEDHPQVKEVYYPGLTNHPGHEIARKQMTGYGGVVSLNSSQMSEHSSTIWNYSPWRNPWEELIPWWNMLQP